MVAGPKKVNSNPCLDPCARFSFTHILTEPRFYRTGLKRSPFSRDSLSKEVRTLIIYLRWVGEDRIVVEPHPLTLIWPATIVPTSAVFSNRSSSNIPVLEKRKPVVPNANLGIVEILSQLWYNPFLKTLLFMRRYLKSCKVEPNHQFDQTHQYFTHFLWNIFHLGYILKLPTPPLMFTPALRDKRQKVNMIKRMQV